MKLEEELMKDYLEDFSLERREEKLYQFRTLVIGVIKARQNGATFDQIAKSLKLGNRQHAHMIYSANKHLL